MKFDLHRIEPGRTVDLKELSTDGKNLLADREAAEREFDELRDELIDWQRQLYAEGRQKLLIVLQAMDAGGKDGTIKSVFKGVNPQGVVITSFKAPSARELAHDFLWRVHQAAPAAGMIGVFNRSHYEDVVIVRVDQLVPKDVWQQRFEQINSFERLLHDTGTRILKFYLHISKKEQAQRFQERIDDPRKRWKFSLADLDKRKQWNDYRTAYEDALTRCSTPWGAWHVIPADQNWYRDLAVMRVIVDTLRTMNPQYPDAVPVPPGLRIT